MDSYLVVTAQKVTAQQAIFLRKILPPQKRQENAKNTDFLVECQKSAYDTAISEWPQAFLFRAAAKRTYEQ